MSHELPPHFHQVKADEERHFANIARNQALDLQLQLGKIKTELYTALEELAMLRAAVRNLRDVTGRFHTQRAFESLMALIPEK